MTFFNIRPLIPLKQWHSQVMCHQQQNKWYPQRCLLAHFEATLDFIRVNLFAHNKLITQVKFVTVVKLHYRNLQLTAVFLTI